MTIIDQIMIFCNKYSYLHVVKK